VDPKKEKKKKKKEEFDEGIRRGEKTQKV